MGLTYKDSGVDVDGGNSFVKRIAPIVRATFSERVITDIGGFGALFSAAFPEYEEPVLVSGTDGVGTKLKIAQLTGRHDTIGIDAVAMCVNDIVVSGARPLFFLDYIACGRLVEDVMVDIVRGLAEGCRQSDCSLVGGETAEHPNVMEPNDYDIAGFSVGIVDRKKIINGACIAPGDLVIGLPSSGLHSNGFSLVRKLFFDIKKFGVDKKLEDLDRPLGEALLVPTVIYTRSILACLASGIDIKGLVHITGGGFYENIPRVLPDTTAVEIEKSSYEIPPLFSIIQKEGSIEEREMFTTFNMGIGMMLFINAQDADRTITRLTQEGQHPRLIGRVIPLQKERVIIG
ncbi:MAG TPA: phosphoribosylformylglycinamidine cyclo-ligase [Spirochaetota bacterium]|nr:phosphoribosylformylglycinamidine cyclo-ligase [Spirochaetota bacterium]HOD14760.1 phosphoribosylformylglycinamidine cyclo-ligase [Spirochaetota bacterium]HPG49084.1 phosphoribosylformylglycinamidine cyclo-ligase [Spirochaetota bacterium]HPN11495.1 phosphoribosylformylglycinamidine cyclo-ligase [Spirochaetota bacterium]